MKPAPIPEDDLRECEDACNDVRRTVAHLLLMKGKVAASAAVFAGCIACEYSLSYDVVYDLLGPLPGEPWSATPAIVSFSGLICVLAFYLYSKNKANAFPARIVSGGAGYIALGYVLFMGLMLARLLYMNSGGGETSGGGLLDVAAASGPSGILRWLFDALNAPFALVFGCLFVCNLYVADYMLGAFIRNITELHLQGTRSREAGELMDVVNSSERSLRELEARRAEVLRKLEPAASLQHANEIAGMIEQARAPLEKRLADWKLRPKRLPSVIHLDDGPEINVVEFEKRLNATKPDAKVIYAAFRGEDDGRKKS